MKLGDSSLGNWLLPSLEKKIIGNISANLCTINLTIMLVLTEKHKKYKPTFLDFLEVCVCLFVCFLVCVVIGFKTNWWRNKLEF